MISIAGLGRRYGSIVALQPLTLDLPAGKTIGLLGANGAGKTTTLNLLTTLLAPSEGSAVIAGCDIRKDPLGVRRAIGYVPEHASAYDGLTADEYLELAGRVRGLPDDTWRPRADRFLTHLGLQDARGRRLGTYSKGMREMADRGRTVLYSSHVLEQVEQLCDVLVLLHHGSLLWREASTSSARSMAALRSRRPSCA